MRIEFMEWWSNGVMGSVFGMNEGLQRMDVKLKWKHDYCIHIDPGRSCAASRR